MMKHPIHKFSILVGWLLFCSSHSAPPGKGNEAQVSDEVKELENLRNTNQPSENGSIPQPSIFRHRTNKKSNAKVEYSPADLAAYVWQTGDEEGVAIAVEQLVREGTMGRTDAINYLQDVKQILREMQTQSTTEPPTSTTPPFDQSTFTLEVIYKLAKDMFTQSILKDDPTAEETLSGLVSFLEKEVGAKHISLHMKEKILETVSAALVDSLREYGGFLSSKPQKFGQAPTQPKPLTQLGIKGRRPPP